MNEQIESNASLAAKWFPVLIYAAIASIANTALNLLPFVPSVLTTWISRGILVVVMVCMFALAPLNKRYKRSAIARLILLAYYLAASIFQIGSASTALAASLFPLFATYSEYCAHSELIAQKDIQLSRKWHSLFNWSLLVSLLVGFGSVMGTLILVMLEMNAAQITAGILTVLSIPQLVIDVVYVLYLKKMLSTLKDDGELHEKA